MAEVEDFDGTTILLEVGDSALVFKCNGDEDAYFANSGEDKIIPEDAPAYKLMVCMIALHDKEAYKFIQERIKAKLDVNPA